MRAQVSAAVVLFPLLSLLLFRDGNAQDADCRRSSCGSLQNISYPFRLKQDPSHCGDPRFELLCQGNQTVLDLFSHQFYVEDITYANQKIRIKDPSLRTDICSSSPHFSLLDLPFHNSFDFSTKPTDMYMRPTDAQEVQFVSWMDPVHSNSDYKNVRFWSNSTFSSSSFLYMVSDLALKKLPSMCTVEASHMCKVALYCIQMKPSSRPSTKKVVEMLQGECEALPMPEKPFLSSLHHIYDTNNLGSTASSLGESSPAISGSGSVYAKTYTQIKVESA